MCVCVSKCVCVCLRLYLLKFQYSVSNHHQETRPIAGMTKIKTMETKAWFVVGGCFLGKSSREMSLAESVTCGHRWDCNLSNQTQKQHL